MITYAHITSAFRIGYRAAQSNAKRAPAASKDFMALMGALPSMPMGSCIPLMESFQSGYQARCDEEAASALVRPAKH